MSSNPSAFPFPPFDSPYKNLIASDTIGDDVSHLVVRCQFLRRLFESGRIDNLYGQYLDQTNLREVLVEIAAATDHFAKVEGYESRGAFYKVLYQGGAAIQVADVERSLDAFEWWNRASAHGQKVLEEVDEAVLKDLHRQAVRYVTSIGCKWVWLAAEIHDGFLEAVMASILGANLTTWVQVGHPVALAAQVAGPPPGFEDGESAETFLGRMRAYMAATEIAYQQRRKPRGRIPKDRIPTLQEYADWFYEARIKQKSMRKIAAEAFPHLPADEVWKNVKYGLNRADTLLSLGAYEFTRGDPMAVELRDEALQGNSLNLRKLARVNYCRREFSP